MSILRTFGVLALAGVLVLSGMGSAFAKGPPDSPPGLANRHGLFGEVSDIQTPTLDTNGGFTLTTRQGIEVSVSVDENTRYKIPGNPNINPDDFSSIDDGDWVAIRGWGYGLGEVISPCSRLNSNRGSTYTS